MHDETGIDDTVYASLSFVIYACEDVIIEAVRQKQVDETSLLTSGTRERRARYYRDDGEITKRRRHGLVCAIIAIPILRRAVQRRRDPANLTSALTLVTFVENSSRERTQLNERIRLVSRPLLPFLLSPSLIVNDTHCVGLIHAIHSNEREKPAIPAIYYYRRSCELSIGRLSFRYY